MCLLVSIQELFSEKLDSDVWDCENTRIDTNVKWVYSTKFSVNTSRSFQVIEPGPHTSQSTRVWLDLERSLSAFTPELGAEHLRVNNKKSIQTWDKQTKWHLH